MLESGDKVALYVALGDSITAGYGVIPQCSFPSLYANYLRRKCPDLCLLNFGVNGLTTKGLLTLLLSHERIRNAVASASLITLTMGSNDLLRFIRTGNFSVNMSQIPLLLNTLNQTLFQSGAVLRQLNPRAAIKIGTIYNPLSAGPFAQYYTAAQGILNQTNSIFASWAKCYGADLVNLDQVISGKELLLNTQDHVHPNAAGYQVIATAFARH